MADSDNATKGEMRQLERRMNEFRDSLRDQAIQFISKNECHLRHEKWDEDHKSLIKKVESLELTRASVEGKASKGTAIFAGTIACVGLLIGIISIILVLVLR